MSDRPSSESPAPRSSSSEGPPHDPSPSDPGRDSGRLKKGRRTFLKQAALGGLSMGAVLGEPIGEQVAYATQNVSRRSAPSDLEITDLRVAQVGNVPIIRIDTNQDVYGLGDVRDGADKRYALMLKSRILGENPCDVERLFKRIEQFGHHGRQGGGVSGVEMALWDLTGKAYGVPVYQLLGGKYRDEIRIYVDTPTVSDPDEFARRMQGRVDQGFDFLKMDVGVGLIDQEPDTITNREFWANPDGSLQGWGPDDLTSYTQTEHGLTRIQLTEKGIEMLAEYPATVRDRIGYEIPLATDHMGHVSVNSCIRVTDAFEPYNMAWMEDLVPWFRTDQWKEITRSVNVPTITGEDIYRLDGFKELIDERAVDVVHPDPVTAGGCLETKKIGDYGEEHGVAMALHHASSPVSFMASCHAAAATRNFVALEHHHVDTEYWEDLVTGIEKPIVEDGYVTIPESPGIGVDLNEEVVREHLADGEEYFAPTDDWNELESWDRLWS